MRCSTPMSVVGLFACAFLLSLNGALAGGCHQPSKDTGDEAGLATDICLISDALERSPPDYVTAEALYRLGYKSRITTLTAITNGTALEGEFVDESIKLFGDKAWMHDVITQALEGTDTFTDDTKRVQVIKKLLQGSVLGHLMFTNMERALRQTDVRDEAIQSVERAMANFFGLESSCAIFGNGQARGIEFGTMDEGASAATINLVESFTDAILAIRDFPVDEENLAIAFNTIEDSFITIYLQAVVKYATRIINDDNATKAQAEGFGYYHAIAAQISDENGFAHDVIYDAFDIASKPNRRKARAALKAVRELVRELGIEELFGEYDENREAYLAPAKPRCEAKNPFAVRKVHSVDSDR